MQSAISYCTNTYKCTPAFFGGKNVILLHVLKIVSLDEIALSNGVYSKKKKALYRKPLIDKVIS